MNKYPKYKPTNIEWIGEIPDHWSIKRMKYEVKYEKGKNPKDLSFNISGKPYLSMEYLRGNPKQTFFVEDFDKFLNVKDDMILLLWDGSNAGEFIKSRDGVLSSTMAVLVIFTNNENYSWYFFKTFERYLKESTIGMGIPHVNGEEFKNQLFITPPIKEQISIANYLDEKTALIDSFIEKKNKLIELLKEERTAVINRAVTKGINPNIKMKHSSIEWLGDIPEHWEILNLKKICSVRQGLQIPISERFSENGLGCYEYITIKSLHNPNDPKEFIRNPSKRVICNTSDLLVARTGATGEIIKGVKGVFHNNFFCVDFNRDKIHLDYLFYYLISPLIKEWLLLVAGTTTIPDLNHREFYETPMLIPQIFEQKQIVEFIKIEIQKIDTTISKIEKEIELIKEYRTALISEVVTGKAKIIDNC